MPRLKYSLLIFAILFLNPGPRNAQECDSGNKVNPLKKQSGVVVSQWMRSDGGDIVNMVRLSDSELILYWNDISVAHYLKLDKPTGAFTGKIIYWPVKLKFTTDVSFTYTKKEKTETYQKLK